MSASSNRWLAFWVGFALLATAVPWTVFRSLDFFGVEPVEVGLDFMDVLRERLPQIEAQVAGKQRRAWEVAYLGDSMVVSYPPGRTVPERLEEAVAALTHGRPRVRVHTVAAPGMGPFDYYFIADEVAGVRPDQVILPFNLTVLSDAWRGTFSRPGLAGWIEPSRIPRALTLPLDWLGLTADRLVSYVAIVQAGAARPWHGFVRQQARLGRAKNLLTVWLGKELGSLADVNLGVARYQEAARGTIIKGRNRLTVYGLRQRFGVALDGVDTDDPVLRMLGASVQHFNDLGIRVLVYVNPVNVAYMEEAGVADAAGLSQTLAAIAATVRSNGGEFADLHALLPDAGFRDPAGHLAVRGDVPDGPLRLAQALAPVVVEEVRFARGAGRKH